MPSLLQPTLLELSQTDGDITPAWLQVVALELERTIRSDDVLLAEELRSLLKDKVEQSLSKLPTATQAELFSSVASNQGAAKAFTAGQASFALRLAERAAIKKASMQFRAAILENPRYTTYITALLNGDLNNQEISAHTKECPETVSRKLKELRALGVSDHKRTGRHVVNFLTPAARELVRAQAPAQLADSRTARESPPHAAFIHLKRLVVHIPTRFQTVPSFADRREVAGTAQQARSFGYRYDHCAQ